jgi:hypothetical protein
MWIALGLYYSNSIVMCNMCGTIIAAYIANATFIPMPNRDKVKNSLFKKYYLKGLTN